MFLCVLLFFFFFSSRRRHTRYIGDWSSDVCSSDLIDLNSALERLGETKGGLVMSLCREPAPVYAGQKQVEQIRSEERRVGKEWRARRSREDEKKKRNRGGSRSV